MHFPFIKYLVAIQRCPYCNAIIDEKSEYCSNCGTQLLFPEDEEVDEEIPGDIILEPEEEDKSAFSSPKKRKRKSRKKASSEEEQIPDEESEKESDDIEEEVIIEKEETSDKERQSEDLEEPPEKEEDIEIDVQGRVEVEEEVKQKEFDLPDEEPQQEDIEERPDEDDYKLFPDEDIPEELSDEKKPDFKTEDLKKMVDPADKEKEDIDKFLDDLKKEREEQKIKSSGTDTLPPWAKNIQNESLDQIKEEDETGEDAEDQDRIDRLMTESLSQTEEPLTVPHETDTGMGLPEKIEQKDLPFYTDSMEKKKGKDWKLPLNILQWARSRALDLLLVAVLWLLGLWVASRILTIPLFQMISTSAISIVGVYLILLVVYFFLFLFFLGETLGDHLFSLRE